VSKLGIPAKNKNGSASIDQRNNTASQEDLTVAVPEVSYIKSEVLDLSKDKTVHQWIKENAAEARASDESRAHLVTSALKFVEQHLREKLGIKEGHPVELEIDTEHRVSSSLKLKSNNWKYSDFAEEKIDFNNLWLEIRGSTFLILSLWDVPASAREHGSWPPVVSVCVDCPKEENWAVTAIGVDLQDSRREELAAFFENHHSLNTKFERITKKKK